MKKIILSVICLLLLVSIPASAGADGPLVPCGNAPDGSDACTICDFFQMLINIYHFIVWDIATPLAVIAIIIGAIMMMLSAGNPAAFGKGKTILWGAIIGLVLVFGSYLIIATVLKIVGYTQNWASMQLECAATTNSSTN